MDSGFLKSYWLNLPSLYKKIVIGAGIYFGITSLMAWSVGYILNNSIYCRPTLRYKKRFDEHDKVYAIVTGANRGIGFGITKDLMLSGCNVILGCRDEKSANEAMIELLKISKQHASGDQKHGKLLFIPLDLASKKSIDAFIHKFFELKIECNVLIHNAAMVVTNEENSFSNEDTMNVMWKINYLSQFYLTLSLLDHIIKISKKYKYGRIVNVNSYAHVDGTGADIEHFMAGDAGDVNKDDIVHRKGVGLYASNKLACVMFIDKLYQYISTAYSTSDGDDILKYLCVCCVHPGIVNTDNLWKDWKIKLFYVQWYLFALLSVKLGAIQILHAVYSEIDNDKYLVNGKYHTNGLYLELGEKTKDLIAKYQTKLWNKSLEIWPVSKAITNQKFRFEMQDS